MFLPQRGKSRNGEEAIMTHAGVEQLTDSSIRTAHQKEKATARCVPLLGGTTTFADCLVALLYLANPRQLVQGEAITEYEQAFARQIGVRYAYSFCHGRVGLYGLLLGLGIGPGDEVLLQVPTHIVVSNAIRYTGAQPIYVDCRPDTFNIDLKQAERLITSRTKGLLLQHTFGIPVELDDALDLARRYNLDVIEDCVHALGAMYMGRQVGSFGRAAFFSSEATKTISTTMGGMVVTDDPELAARIQAFQQSCTYPSTWLVARYMLKMVLFHLLYEPHLYRYIRAIYEYFGQRHPLPRPTNSEERHGNRPFNYEQRLSNAQAMLGLRQLRHLEMNLAHRRATAALYNMRLSEGRIDVPHPPANAEPAFVRYPVRVKDPAAVRHMAARHATLGTWFNSVLEEADAPTCGNYETGSCPQAEALAGQLINLPTHQRVSKQDAERIISAVIRAAASARE
jgi:perosamine synthetase